MGKLYDAVKDGQVPPMAEGMTEYTGHVGDVQLWEQIDELKAQLENALKQRDEAIDFALDIKDMVDSKSRLLTLMTDAEIEARDALQAEREAHAEALQVAKDEKLASNILSAMGGCFVTFLILMMVLWIRG